MYTILRVTLNTIKQQHRHHAPVYHSSHIETIKTMTLQSWKRILFKSPINTSLKQYCFVVLWKQQVFIEAQRRQQDTHRRCLKRSIIQYGGFTKLRVRLWCVLHIATHYQGSEKWCHLKYRHQVNRNPVKPVKQTLTVDTDAP